MPTQNVTLITLRGTAMYGWYLDRLLKAAREAGHTIRDRSELTDLALSTLGAQWGLKAPRRALPSTGVNMHTKARMSRKKSSVR